MRPRQFFLTKRFTMYYNVAFLLLYLFSNSFSFNSNSIKESNFLLNKNKKTSSYRSDSHTMIASIYQNLNANQFELPNYDSFAEGLKGYYTLKEKGLIKKEILTLIDFSLSANTKRLWVIDLATNTILFHSLVAHGKNTGDEFATKFSNQNSSFQSSLGFYSTGEIYQGKHGASLKLDGLEEGLNNNARSRAIVIHGADYVSDKFIKQNKRLGRSLGCPALPKQLNMPIITTIKDKSLLFIYHPSRKKEENNQALTS